VVSNAQQSALRHHNPRASSANLLDGQASGGDIAGQGFSFQENVVLARIPMWLSRDGFAGMICEALGDTEARFYRPGQGEIIELLEVKNHRVTPAEFWREIDRFQQLDQAAPGVYAWFTLVTAGLSEELHPLLNGLRRIRGAYGFYADGSAVASSSFSAFTERVQSLGRQEADARFILEKVLLDSQHSETQDHGEGLFIESLNRWLPEYQDLPYNTLKSVHRALGNLVRQRPCQATGRAELEGLLNEPIPVRMRPEARPVFLRTPDTVDEGYSGPALNFDWADFFGGTERRYPLPPEWQHRVVGELEATRDWILKNRASRTVHLQGNRRLSTALSIGSIFSAVGGFVVEMEYRGEIWRTDRHPDSATPPYVLQQDFRPGAGDHLVVTLGIAKDLTAEVQGDLSRHGLQSAPVLNLSGTQAILSPAHANAAIRAIKSAIAAALLSTKSQHIHLYYAGPSHLALFLGHRLNATAPVQCYEWVGPGHYVPTCALGAAEPRVEIDRPGDATHTEQAPRS